MSEQRIKLLTIVAAVFGPLLGFILIIFNVPEGVFDAIPIIIVAIILLLIAMFIFSAWRQRNVATREEKHSSFQSILSFILIGGMCLNPAIAGLLPFIILMILLVVLVLIGWNWYMRSNADLSNQKFHLINFLCLMNIVLSCFSLVSISDSNFNIKFFLFAFTSFGITAVYAFQNLIFKEIKR